MITADTNYLVGLFSVHTSDVDVQSSMASASTNILVQPIIFIIGSGVLIWLLGYSALVGIGVSRPGSGCQL
jgi:hypothetical protein